MRLDPRKTVQTVQPGVVLRKCGTIDTRTPITLWQLLIWAYARQMVRFERCENFTERARNVSSTGRVCADLSAGAVIRGGLAIGGSRAHVDAISVHEWVLRLPPDERYLLIDTAERQMPPDWNPRLPELRVVKVLRPNGEVRTLKDRRGKAIASLIEYEGVGMAERTAILERARARYAQWWRALWVLREAMLSVDDLTRWRITGIGAEERPFSTGEQL